MVQIYEISLIVPKYLPFFFNNEGRGPQKPPKALPLFYRWGNQGIKVNSDFSQINR